MKLTVGLILIAFIYSSCATIIGGSKYTANVTVDNNSKAEIFYNGTKIGVGSASVKVPRKDANKVNFTLKDDGCEDLKINFTDRVFRGWAFVGTIVTFTGTTVPVPYGLIVDLATGALFKPDANHMSIRKFSMNSYMYTLEYAGCDAQKYNPPSPVINSQSPVERPVLVAPTIKTKEQKLMELKELFDGGMITEEEYQESRKAILAQ